MTDTKEIQIPFSGFYESMHSDAIDQEINSYFDVEGCGEEDLAPEDFWMKFDGHGFIQIAYCKKYVEHFVYLFNEVTELDIKLEFKDMSSPKEYNFTTDRIFCDISEEDIKKIFGKTKTQTLAETIKDNFTSYDGFHSFYSNQIKDWFSDGKGVLDFDHNELMTLLEACLKDHYTGDDLSFELYQGLAEGGEVGEIVYEHVGDFIKDNPELDPNRDDEGDLKPARCSDTIELRLV